MKNKKRGSVPLDDWWWFKLEEDKEPRLALSYKTLKETEGDILSIRNLLIFSIILFFAIVILKILNVINF